MIRTFNLRSRVVLQQGKAGIVARIERHNNVRRTVEWAGPLARGTVRALREVAQ